MDSTLPQPERETIRVPVGHFDLQGELVLPGNAVGLVVITHGSGGDRFSAANQGNRQLANVLNRGSFATIVLDLHPPGERPIDLRTDDIHYDIEPLAHRLSVVTDWIGRYDVLSELRLGYLGAGTGAAACLVAAAERPDVVQAVVSLGGRPDLTGPAFRWVRAHCLFIVGDGDPVELDLNRDMIAEFPPGTNRRLEIIRGATHFADEPVALDLAARSALKWFQRYLTGPPVPCFPDQTEQISPIKPAVG